MSLSHPFPLSHSQLRPPSETHRLPAGVNPVELTEQVRSIALGVSRHAEEEIHLRRAAEFFETKWRAEMIARQDAQFELAQAKEYLIKEVSTSQVLVQIRDDLSRELKEQSGTIKALRLMYDQEKSLRLDREERLQLLTGDSTGAVNIWEQKYLKERKKKIEKAIIQWKYRRLAFAFRCLKDLMNLSTLDRMAFLLSGETSRREASEVLYEQRLSEQSMVIDDLNKKILGESHLRVAVLFIAFGRLVRPIIRELMVLSWSRWRLNVTGVRCRRLGEDCMRTLRDAEVEHITVELEKNKLLAEVNEYQTKEDILVDELEAREQRHQSVIKTIQSHRDAADKAVLYFEDVWRKADSRCRHLEGKLLQQSQGAKVALEAEVSARKWAEERKNDAEMGALNLTREVQRLAAEILSLQRLVMKPNVVVAR